MSYQLTAWAVKQKTGSATKKSVLMALANAASHHTSTCEPKIDLLAEETELNERTVRRALDDLVVAGFIAREMKHRANGHRAGYVYSFPCLPDTVPASDSGLPDSPPGELPDSPPGQELREVQEQEDPPPQPVLLVANAWSQHAPPLIQHRPSFLASHVTKACIERALRVYPVEVVAEAIANYATVLGGADYRWSHSWTLPEFLKRGLDRFVPEARPLENFRIRAAEKFGRRDVSSRELLDLADRLESEDQQRAID